MIKKNLEKSWKASNFPTFPFPDRSSISGLHVSADFLLIKEKIVVPTVHKNYSFGRYFNFYFEENKSIAKCCNKIVFLKYILMGRQSY